jgi:hypothetical protein
MVNPTENGFCLSGGFELLEVEFCGDLIALKLFRKIETNMIPYYFCWFWCQKWMPRMVKLLKRKYIINLTGTFILREGG